MCGHHKKILARHYPVDYVLIAAIAAIYVILAVAPSQYLLKTAACEIGSSKVKKHFRPAGNVPFKIGSVSKSLEDKVKQGPEVQGSL